MMRRLAALALVPGMLVFGSAPAQADETSYLGYLDAHGFKYQNHVGVTTPDGAVRFGQVICQNLRHGRPARDRFDPKLASGIDQVMIDGAQRELCPETLAKAPAPPGAPPLGAPLPPPGAPPAPEPAPAPEQPPAPWLPPPPEAPGPEAPGPEAPPAPDGPAQPSPEQQPNP